VLNKQTLNILGIEIPLHPETFSRDVSFIEKQLLQEIQHRLESKFDDVVQTLYQLDVSESKVRQLFKPVPNSEELAESLTTLIIERIKKKIEYRQKYSNPNSSLLDESF
jgi:Tfp pilus assembly PilM family ATPase